MEGTFSPTWYIVVFPVSLITEHADGGKDTLMNNMHTYRTIRMLYEMI